MVGTVSSEFACTDVVSTIGSEFACANMVGTIGSEFACANMVGTIGSEFACANMVGTIGSEFACANMVSTVSSEFACPYMISTVSGERRRDSSGRCRGENGRACAVVAVSGEGVGGQYREGQGENHFGFHGGCSSSSSLYVLVWNSYYADNFD
ncbi:hypothetical protein [Pseudomonas sp. S2_C03]